MFLRCTNRKKDGKEHRYWSVVENHRVAGGRVVQRQVLYLGEINDCQREAWLRTIEVLEDGASSAKTMALFPDDRMIEINDDQVVQIRLKDLELRHPRQFGACWLACTLYEQLGLDTFWAQRLPPSRKGTRWHLIVEALCCYRLIDPGSEWRLHRHWYEASAMSDLLGSGFELVEIHKLYECLDRLIEHKRALFDHLTRRWRDLFNTRFDVLLYDLTSTYFESSPPFPEGDKRKFGYSRDKRSDCVQVVIALIVTPEGFPLAYEVMAGNTTDNTTLKGFLKKIEEQYGKAERVWVMDRGIPTEEVLNEMRETSVYYLVGTPKGRLTRYEKTLTDLPWHRVRDGVDVKLLPRDNEVYVLARSRDRIHKERSIRQRQLKRLWKRLNELKDMDISRDQLLLKLGAAKQQAPSAWRFVEITLPKEDASFQFSLRKDKLRKARRREGRYLLKNQPRRQRPRRDVGVLHPAGSRRRRIQEPERGPLSSADPSSERTADRGPHLRRLHGLRPSRDLATPSAQLGAGTDSSGCHREVRYPSDDRRPSPHNRWSQGDHVPIHQSGAGLTSPAQATAPYLTRPASAPNGGRRHRGHTECSEDLLRAPSMITLTCDRCTPRIR
jgi:hypothetical protein